MFVMKRPARTVGSVTSAAEIVPLGPESLGEASTVLARAFHDTVLARFVTPDARQRRRLLPLMYETVVRYSLRYGTVLTTPDVSGVCCCLGPQRPRPSLRRLLRCGVDLSLLRLGPVGLWRQLAVDRRVRSLHGRIPPPQHWYVWAIGVDPVHQGRGTGRQLLAPILQSADDAGLPCYLETEEPATVRFYQRLGFETRACVDVARGALRIMAMLRAPAPAV